MGYQIFTGRMTSRDPQRCSEAVRPAIPAIAWLLVDLSTRVTDRRADHDGRNALSWAEHECITRWKCCRALYRNKLHHAISVNCQPQAESS